MDKSKNEKACLTRRGFLGGSALGVLGASMAVSGLLTGCAPAQSRDSAAGDAAGEEAGTDLGLTVSPQAALNPQDFDFRDNTTDFATLFSPWKLGSIELSHRMVKSAAGTGAFDNGLEKLSAYYTNFAKGGVEMIWCESFANQLRIAPKSPRKPVAEYPAKEFTDAVHAAGGHIGYQFDTMWELGGSNGFTFSSGTGKTSDLSSEQLQMLIEDIVATAVSLQEAGFDAFELNCGANNIGQYFLSRERNDRDDEYGPQSIENRTRFGCEVIRGIKEQCGENFVVQVLINGVEENDEHLGDNALCSTVEEAKQIAKRFEEAGADSLHIRIGAIYLHICQFLPDLYFTGYGIDGSTGYGTQFDFSRHYQGKLVGNHSGYGVMLDVAAEIKSAVSIPVGTVGGLDPAYAPDYFEAALRDGKVDFFMMNRPFIADWNYVNKLHDGRIDEIAPCTRCTHCYRDTDVFGNTTRQCRVNATFQRAYGEEMPEGYDPLPADGQKKVMVVGGGPAGMEAARVVAERGYDVTLYEKKDGLGGTLDFANSVKGEHESLWRLRDYLTRQIELRGVNVVTGQEVDRSFIEKEAPDAVVWAVGGVRDSLGLADVGGTKIVSMENFLMTDLGENVTIVGTNLQAFDTALYLLAKGKNVTMVTPDPIEHLDKGQSSNVRTLAKPMLFSQGVRVWAEAAVSEVRDGEIVIVANSGVEQVIPCDSVIEAMDLLPNTEVVDALSNGVAVYPVGDCSGTYNISSAISAANLAARQI